MPRLFLFFLAFILAIPAYAQNDIAIAGRPTACINAYSMGTFSEALIECALAAQQGNPEAMTFMGGMYYKGQGVEQSYAEAYKWYQQAADKGWADADFSLAKMYEKGLGVEQDYEKAFEHLKKAAAKDHLYAIYNIGYFYGKGYVGDKADYTQASEWFTKAANRRHAHAMYGLSTLYSYGLGVGRDEVKALMWAKLASKYGIPQADDMASKLINMLSGEQIATATKLAEEWERAHP